MWVYMYLLEEVMVSLSLGAYPEVELLDPILPFAFLWFAVSFQCFGVADTRRSHALCVTHLEPES